MKQNPVTAYLLAGGKSSRMGTDKAFLDFRGKPIARHIIDQLKPFTDRVVMVSNNRDHAAFGLEVIPDIIRDSGPAGGIHAALHHSTTDHNFIVSCDMPFITTAAVEYLAGRAAEAQIVVPVHAGRTEPLFGLYSRSCLSRWDAQIRLGMFKLQEMIACFDLLKIDVGEHPLFNHPLFVNINSPEDLEQALTLTDL